MRIVCPDCAAAYEVPERMLADRRDVRCARCGREWTPEPPTPAGDEGRGAFAPPPSALPAGPAPSLDIASRAGAAVLDRPSTRPARAEETPSAAEPAFTPPPEPSPPVRDAQKTVRLAWAGSVLLLIAIVWAVIAWRTAIMHAWPPSERVFAVLGLA